MARYRIEAKMRKSVEMTEEWFKDDKLLKVLLAWRTGEFEVETDDPSIFNKDEITINDFDEWELISTTDCWHMDMDPDVGFDDECDTDYIQYLEGNGWDIDDTIYKIFGGVTATLIGEEVSDFIKEGAALKEGTA